MTENDYECPVCVGEGAVECDYCGSEITCEKCHGTGLDPNKIDVKAWRLAAKMFGNNQSVWDWEMDGKTLGLKSDDGSTLAYVDFLAKGGPA